MVLLCNTAQSPLSPITVNLGKTIIMPTSHTLDVEIHTTTPLSQTLPVIYNRFCDARQIGQFALKSSVTAVDDLKHRNLLVSVRLHRRRRKSEVDPQWEGPVYALEASRSTLHQDATCRYLLVPSLSEDFRPG
jgi:hypothetical protein